MFELCMPWALNPRIAASIFESYKVFTLPLPSRQTPEKLIYRITDNGVGIITIKGILLRSRPRWFSGEYTVYSRIGKALYAATIDPQINHIHLEVNSPGGQLSGLTEALYPLQRAAARKPVTAYIEDQGTSAAYWLASQTTGGITANRLAEIGGIGSFVVYTDSSKHFEQEGVKVIVIRSGPHKGMDVPGARISDTQIDGMQQIIDNLKKNEVADIARGRKRHRQEIERLATGQVWLAERAFQLGLIDQVT